MFAGGMLTKRVPAYYCLVVLTFTILYYNWHIHSPKPPAFNLEHSEASNSTLGFGGIYVVSGPGSPRRDGLIQAANVTKLDFTIPNLPSWTDGQVMDFKYNENETISNGSVKAWLSHHVVLQEFLKSGHETALILEDDVDWDIRLRTKQVPLVAAATRSLLPKTDDRHYWGHPGDWELLYLGHCGDSFTGVDNFPGIGAVHPEDLEGTPHKAFLDETLPDRTNLHPYTASLFTAFSLPEKTRMVHKSKWPLCTFGYAVTQSSARRIIEDFAPSKQKRENGPTAYDIAILEACRDSNLRCMSVNPELFHHMEGVSLIDGKVDTVVYRPPIDRLGLQQVLYRNETCNIGCGFYSKDFRWDTVNRLRYLREEVGGKGRCLKPGRREDGSIARG